MRIPPEKDEPERANLERACATMRRALDVGINHIETARFYGESEHLIGVALKQGVIRREEFYLTTKVAPAATGDEFRKTLEVSMRELGVDYVDVLDLHGINTPELLELSMRRGGSHEAALKAVDEGIVGHVGFSTHGPLEVILDTIATDGFASVNLHYYFVNQRNLPAVRLAAEKDMGVYIISPTDKGGMMFDPPAKLVELCAPWTPIEMNQRWLLAQQEVHSLSLGCAKPEEFDAHLAMANRPHPPLAADERAIFDRLDAAMDVLGDTLCTFCHACLPCPQDVIIPEILRVRNLVLAYGMEGFGRYRYKMLAHRDPQTGERSGGADHWFPGTNAEFCNDCGDCLPRCPQKLQIPLLLRETHAAIGGEVGKRLWE
jgi:predicted aldo/keto reductase-like oxidoreductase